MEQLYSFYGPLNYKFKSIYMHVYQVYLNLQDFENAFKIKKKLYSVYKQYYQESDPIIGWTLYELAKLAAWL